MHLVTLDFETYWSQTHTLKKMPPLVYAMHKDTEIISLSAAVGDEAPVCVFGEDEVVKLLQSLNIGKSLTVGHNMSGFDCYLMSNRLRFFPRLYGCTMAMARPHYAKTVGLSLGALVEHFGLGKKDATALHETRGKHLADFTAQERRAMAVYNNTDTDQCRQLFKLLRPMTSGNEMWAIDSTIRMRTEPKFVVDVAKLETALSIERSQKLALLSQLALELGIKRYNIDNDTTLTEDEMMEQVRAMVASAPKFASFLEQHGIEVPMKASPTNGAPIPALAKTDEGFLALLESDNPIVATAARCRLSQKSTLLETRIDKFLQAAEAGGGCLHVPINYCGADTTGRDSGSEYNMQNLPRISSDKSKPSNALRYSMKAPPGHVVMVADLSSIEMRVNHFLWQVQGSMELYKADPEADLYRAFAAARYNISPEAVSKAQRQLAKVAQLGLGFGAGWATFRKVAKTMGGLDLSDEDAQLVTNDWRGTYFQIVNGWRKCHAHLPDILAGREQEIDPWGLCHTSSDGIVLPSGRIIRYPDLRYEQGSKGKEWWYGQGRHRARIYAGKIDENCLAEGTLVLTDRGWVPIETITQNDLVHDGTRFVGHDGLVARGTQSCVLINGVYMTPDHEVLENGNWVEASQCKRPDRADVRDADRLVGGECRQGPAMAVRVPVRNPMRKGGAGRYQGSQARRHAELWVHDGTPDRLQEYHARDVQTQGVRSVPLDGGPLHAGNAPGVGKLRRAWHKGVRRLAWVFRGVLAGHGRNLQAQPGPGPQGQRGWIQPGELPLGNEAGERHEQTDDYSGHRHPEAECRDLYKPIYALRTGEIGVAAGETHDSASTDKQVFDILNCGPLHRFVVLGSSGPFIVHNCVQALARDVVFGNALDFFKETNLRPSLRVHDELVYVVEEAAAQELLDTLQAIMRTPPSWWPELITWSEGDIAPTYGDAK